MLGIYRSLMNFSTPFLKNVLNKRAKQGKEDPARLNERMGIASVPRPDAPLIWLHAASVGEAQSMLILIESLQKKHADCRFLITTGTKTSATLMEKRLPRRATHQYYPVDHPAWVTSFLDHWHPDAIIWMESELWPNMIMEIKKRDIPVVIANARMSDKSFARWQKTRRNAQKLLSVFSMIMTQTNEDAEHFKQLGAASESVLTTGNLKYSAAPLPFEEEDLTLLKQSIAERPFWVYASTHDGEEDLACRLHQQVQKQKPDLLTIIVPRHPERRSSIEKTCAKFDMKHILRGDKKALPITDTQIYIVDTLGEMGLFYELAPVSCIGRSFSNDGGGGHNPIEAAQKHCAVLHGPKIQNLQQIYDDMNEAGAAIKLKDEKDFENRLARLLGDEEGLIAMQNKAYRFVNERSGVVDDVMVKLSPLIDAAISSYNAPHHQNQKEKSQKCG